MKSRLHEIKKMITNNYYEIWDTCCDHGKLGLELLNSTNAKKIHFVDCIPSIMESLQSKLEKLELTDSQRIELHTKQAEKIRLSSERSLICICGVGSLTAIEIISGILKNNFIANHDIILCVQHKTPKLRQFLIDNGFKLLQELLCFEGKWAHEILKVSKNSGSDIDLVGTSMFDMSDERHKKYIQMQIKLYENKQYSDTAKKLFESYKSI